jgi:hypothetical protein
MDDKENRDPQAPVHLNLPQTPKINFARFCLNLVSILNRHNLKQTQIQAPHPSEIVVLEKQLRLSSQMLKLRTIEMADSAFYILNQLESHQESLKGDYLQGIINQIKSVSDRLEICNTSGFCALTRDVSSNHLKEVCTQVMKMFATLLKQLKSTQNQVNKYKKQHKESQMPRDIKMQAQRAGS